MDTRLVQSLIQAPPSDETVFYFFRPFETWNVGKCDGMAFYGRNGFCDLYDAPWWRPMVDHPSELPGAHRTSERQPETNQSVLIAVDGQWQNSVWNGTTFLIRGNTGRFGSRYEEECTVDWWVSMPAPPLADVELDID